MIKYCQTRRVWGQYEEISTVDPIAFLLFLTFFTVLAIFFCSPRFLFFNRNKGELRPFSGRPEVFSAFRPHGEIGKRKNKKQMISTKKTSTRTIKKKSRNESDTVNLCKYSSSPNLWDRRSIFILGYRRCAVVWVDETPPTPSTSLLIEGGQKTGVLSTFFYLLGRETNPGRCESVHVLRGLCVLFLMPRKVLRRPLGCCTTYTGLWSVDVAGFLTKPKGALLSRSTKNMLKGECGVRSGPPLWTSSAKQKRTEPAL